MPILLALFAVLRHDNQYSEGRPACRQLTTACATRNSLTGPETVPVRSNVRQVARANGTEMNPLNLTRVMPAQERSRNGFDTSIAGEPEADFLIAGSEA